MEGATGNRGSYSNSFQRVQCESRLLGWLLRRCAPRFREDSAPSEVIWPKAALSERTFDHSDSFPLSRSLSIAESNAVRVGLFFSEFWSAEIPDTTVSIENQVLLLRQDPGGGTYS